MINIPPVKSSTPIKLENLPDITKAWKVGQVLNATTQQGGKALSTVLIRLGQYTLEAKTPIALQDGEAIKLEVKALSENDIPLLRILNKQPASLTKADLATLKLRQFIATQQNFSQTQQLADELLNTKAFANKLPDVLAPLLKNLQSTLLLDNKQMNAATVKKALLNSGLFFESKIFNLKTSGQTPALFTDLKFSSGFEIASDFKFQLLNIKNQLTQLLPVPPTNSTLNHAISTTQFQQLITNIQQAFSDNRQSPLKSVTEILVNFLPKASLHQLSQYLTEMGIGKNSLENISATKTLPEALVTLGKLLTASLQSTSQTPLQLQQQLSFHLKLLELNQQIEQSIGKTSALQLQPLSREGDNLVLLFFSLIFKDEQQKFDLHLRIQEENKDANESDENWSVLLSFNFKTLGKVQSKIHLSGNQVSTSFHTELASTQHKIQSLLPILQSTLSKTGLIINNLSVDNTLLADKPFTSKQSNLLDENA